MKPHPTSPPLIWAPHTWTYTVAYISEIVWSKNQVNWRIKQGLEGNLTKKGIQKETNIDNNTFASPHTLHFFLDSESTTWNIIVSKLFFIWLMQFFFRECDWDMTIKPASHVQNGFLHFSVMSWLKFVSTTHGRKNGGTHFSRVRLV